MEEKNIFYHVIIPGYYRYNLLLPLKILVFKFASLFVAFASVYAAKSPLISNC